MANQIVKNLKIGDTTYTLGGNEGENPLIYQNRIISPSNFSNDKSLEGFSYKGTLALEKMTTDIFPLVIFSAKDALSENFAPVAESYNGGIYIYAKEKPLNNVNILTIMGYKGDQII